MCEICDQIVNSSPGSLTEFLDIKKRIQESDLFDSRPVSKPKHDVGLEESWFRCRSCDSVIRFIDPDSPFRGAIELVATDQAE